MISNKYSFFMNIYINESLFYLNIDIKMDNIDLNRLILNINI